MIKSLEIADKEEGVLMLVADGLSGEYDELLGRFPVGEFSVVGCLSGGDVQLGRTFQLLALTSLVMRKSSAMALYSGVAL